MLKILIAPNAFKGTFSPAQVARAIAHGVDGAIAHGIAALKTLVPVADGGDGTMEAVFLLNGGKFHNETVCGPRGAPHGARWLETNNEAVVELAEACGLALCTGDLRALDASTTGLGQLIRAGVERGIHKINVGLGGSASTDGGMGALAALGAVFLDRAGTELRSYGGRDLARVSSIDLTQLRQLLVSAGSPEFHILTDVENPLLGTNGAAHIFGPQKGATAGDVRLLDDGLRNFADALERETGSSVRDLPGAGAAGGTGFGLACALGAKIESGFDWLSNTETFETNFNWCDIVISGEGKFDSQSMQGKVIGQLAKRCAQARKRLWIVAGGSELERAQGIEKILVPTTAAGGHCSADEIANIIERALTECHL